MTATQTKFETLARDYGVALKEYEETHKAWAATDYNNRKLKDKAEALGAALDKLRGPLWTATRNYALQLAKNG